MLTGQKRFSGRIALSILLSLPSCVLPGVADVNPTQSLVATLSSGSALGSRQLIGVVNVDGVVSVFVSDKENSPDEDLRKASIGIVKAINVDGLSPLKILSIDFVATTQNEFAAVHRITLQDKELAALRSASADDAESLKLLAGATVSYEQMTVPVRSTATVKVASVQGDNAVHSTKDIELSRQFISLRAKAASRLTSLQSKGVGVRPFQTNLVKIDALYKQDDLKGAFAGLSGLQEAISDQESRIYAMHAKVASAQPTIQVRGGGSIGEVPVNTASRDDYYNKMVQNILAKELGGDAPVDGPFQLERFRIAKAMHQFSSEGKDMSGPHYLFKQIESLISTKDNSKIPEIVDKLNYLQKQLGLPPLSR
jgi:hypothetical protein